MLYVVLYQGRLSLPTTVYLCIIYPVVELEYYHVSTDLQLLGRRST